MKIAFLTQTYPNISYNGVSLYAYNLTEAISHYEDVTVFLPDINKEHLSTFETGAVHQTVKTIHLPFLKSFSYMYNISRQINDSEFDIIHSQGGAGLLLNTTKPFIETFHHWPKGLKTNIDSVPHQLCLKKADNIIAVSKESVEHDSAHFRTLRKKICVIPNGIDNVFFQQLKNQLTEELKCSLGIKEEKIILHINTFLSPRKNLPLMLDTICYLKDNGIHNIRLIIIAPKYGEEKVLSQAKQKGVLQQVTYVSNIPRERMPYYYSIIDFFAMPSVQEGFGFPLVESVAMNKPFVSLNTGIAPDLEKHGFGSVASSEKEFKVKCLEMVRNPMRFTGGKAFVENNYSWDTCAKRYIEIYKMLER